MSSFSAAVWDREGGGHVMSKNMFALMLTFWTAAGIGASAVFAYVALSWQLGWGAYLLALLVSIVGVVIAMKSRNPAISLLGYALVVVPFGIITGPLVALYTTASVFKVLGITTAMVVVLGIAGAIYPKSLEGWVSYLFGGLLILIFGQFGIMIAGMFGANVGGALTLWDWVGVVLFSAYVIYDLNRAMRVPRTHDNAIDCALAIYLDFANLFIRLLSLTGQRKDD